MNETAAKSASRGKSEEKAQQILDAAASLFIREGFENVSMEQIAREAGVAKQTVYSHYANKEALFTAAIECKCEEHQLHGVDENRSVAQYLREFAQHFSDLITSREGVTMHRVCIAEAGRSRVGELFWDAGPEHLHAILDAYLRKQVAAGQLNIDNIDFAAQHFLYMIKGKAHMRGMLGLPNEQALAELPAYLDSCVDVFMRAYGPAPGERSNS